MKRAWMGVLALGLCFIDMTPAKASHDDDEVFFEPGIASTGLNRRLGVPLWYYPNLEFLIPIFGDFAPLAGFNTAGEFDPDVGMGGGNSLELTPAVDPDSLIATHLDVFGMSLLGVDPDTVPLDKLNVPYDQVEVLADDFGVGREHLPCSTDVPYGGAITRAAPCTEDITIGEWMSANGFSVISCHADGTATMSQLGWNLRPNRMYSIWYVAENFAAGPTKTVTAFPFGGVPNIVTTDKHGVGYFERELSYCPHDDPQAMGWVWAYRANGTNYGGVPVPFSNQNDPNTAFEGYEALFPGTVINVHLSFNINGVPFEP